MFINKNIIHPHIIKLNILIIKLILKEEKIRERNNRPFNIPMRPDHGHTIIYDQDKIIIPGYSLLGRMKGLAELKGIIKALN